MVDVLGSVNTFDSKQLFSNIDLIRNFSHEIDIDSTIQPVSHLPRKLPPAILIEIKKSLEMTS